MKKKNFYIIIIIISLFITAIDQVSKCIVNSTINFGHSKVIIKDFFSITNARNFGAAWSILWNERIYIIIITCVAFIFVLFLLFREKVHNNYKSLYYGLLIGGIIGNLIDRVFLGYVIDFLDFRFFGFNYPIFNISDVAIVISILLICVECFFPNDTANNNISKEVEVIDFDE